ncbi:MAG: hypothetical protein M3O35_10185 [Acidobacteriota bacterium]|nr:hypothetical protein [Acidobacteriota bacterium]
MSSLLGREGELVSVRISVEPKVLEDLLEALAGLDFPVNPQLHHKPALVTVEFPAWTARLEEVRAVLRDHGFNPTALESTAVLTPV